MSVRRVLLLWAYRSSGRAVRLCIAWESRFLLPVAATRCSVLSLPFPLCIYAASAFRLSFVHYTSAFAQALLYPSKSSKPLVIHNFPISKSGLIQAITYPSISRHGGRQPIPIWTLNGSSRPLHRPLRAQLLPAFLPNAVHTHLVPHPPHDRMCLCVNLFPPRKAHPDPPLTIPGSRNRRLRLPRHPIPRNPRLGSRRLHYPVSLHPSRSRALRSQCLHVARPPHSVHQGRRPLLRSSKPYDQDLCGRGYCVLYGSRDW